MCTSPLKIKNPKIVHDSVIAFNARYDKEFLEVPCGCCPSCQSVKLMEWRSRAWAEFNLAKHDGGKTVFLTLTWNDEYLPKYKGVPCFSKSDAQKFFKNLRKQFKKVLGHNVCFRYFLTTEYGHLLNRPHIHLLLFFHEFVDDVTIFKLAWCCWSEHPSDAIKIYDSLPYTHKTDISAYTSCGHRGIVQVGKDSEGKKNLLVNDIRGINYCSKYLVKDMYFNDVKQRLFVDYVKFRFPSFDSENLVLGSKFVKDNPTLYLMQNEFLTEFKNYDTFHLQSVGFGSSLLNDLNVINIGSASCPIPSLENDKVDSQPLPLYIQRKLYFDVKKVCKGLKCELKQPSKRYPYHRLKLSWDISPCYELNHNGFEQRLHTLDDVIRKKCDAFYRYRTLPVNDEFMRLYFPDFENVHLVWVDFFNMLAGRSLYSLFEYELVFRNRNVITLDIERSCGFNTSCTSNVKLFYCLFNDPKEKHFEFTIHPFKYNSALQFDKFDLCLDVLRKFKKFDSWLKHNKSLLQYNTRQKVDSTFGRYRSPRLKSYVPLYKF